MIVLLLLNKQSMNVSSDIHFFVYRLNPLSASRGPLNHMSISREGSLNFPLAVPSMAIFLEKSEYYPVKEVGTSISRLLETTPGNVFDSILPAYIVTVYLSTV